MGALKGIGANVVACRAFGACTRPQADGGFNLIFNWLVPNVFKAERGAVPSAKLTTDLHAVLSASARGLLCYAS